MANLTEEVVLGKNEKFITEELLEEYNTALQESIPYSIEDGKTVVTADKGIYEELKATTVNNNDSSNNVATTEFVKKAIVKMMFIG